MHVQLLRGDEGVEGHFDITPVMIYNSLQSLGAGMITKWLFFSWPSQKAELLVVLVCIFEIIVLL